MSYATAQSGMGAPSAPGTPLDPKQQICFDFTKGTCTRGAGCKYSHDPEVIASVNSHERGICFDWLRGSCTRGVLCRFSHDITNMLAQQQAQQLQQQQILSLAGRRSTAICYDYVKGLCTRHDCRYTHDLTSIIHGLHPTTAPAVEICFDFSRGKCLRGAVCKYAHDPRIVHYSPLMSEYPQQHMGAATPPLVGMPPPPSYLPSRPPMMQMQLVHFAALQQEHRMRLAQGFNSQAASSSGMGERYAAAHSTAQQHVQLLAARQQRPVCSYQAYGRQQADGRYQQGQFFVPLHSMRHDVPPVQPPQPQPRPQAPASRAMDRPADDGKQHQAALPQMPGSQQAPAHSLPVRQEVGAPHETKMAANPAEALPTSKTSADGGDEGAVDPAWEEPAMQHSPPDDCQLRVLDSGQQTVTLALQAVSMALKSKLHVHQRTSDSIGADWSSQNIPPPPPPLPVQQATATPGCGTPRASAAASIPPAAGTPLQTLAGAGALHQRSASAECILDPECPAPRRHPGAQPAHAGLVTARSDPLIARASSGPAQNTQRTEFQADSNSDLMQHLTSIWAMSPPRMAV